MEFCHGKGVLGPNCCWATSLLLKYHHVFFCCRESCIDAGCLPPAFGQLVSTLSVYMYIIWYDTATPKEGRKVKSTPRKVLNDHTMVLSLAYYLYIYIYVYIHSRWIGSHLPSPISHLPSHENVITFPWGVSGLWDSIQAAGCTTMAEGMGTYPKKSKKRWGCGCHIS